LPAQSNNAYCAEGSENLQGSVQYMLQDKIYTFCSENGDKFYASCLISLTNLCTRRCT